MKRKIAFCVAVLLYLQGLAGAEIRSVPSRTYPDIKTAIKKSNDGDEIVVAPNPNPYYPVAYNGPNNVNLDFGNKKITLRSQINPANPDWDIINSTIIDCGGAPPNSIYADGGAANRAFYFHNGQTSDIKVIGFTIRNGYARGPKGADGEPGFFGQYWRDEPFPGLPWQTFPPFDELGADDDPCTFPPVALEGMDADGPAWGGAILCENESSPTIQYCVFENCTVTGAHGGKGAMGLWGLWFYFTWEDFNFADQSLTEEAEVEESTDGQGGGQGGNGSGNGYGGAIACKNFSNPTINNCIFRDNSAQGGRGGDGGDGGWAAYPPFYTDGAHGPGGNAGDSYGDGIGGAIYAEGGCNPVIKSCHFEDDSAKTGPRAKGGIRGVGNDSDPASPGTGESGRIYAGNNPGIAGGAVYIAAGSEVELIDCNFVSNRAYHEISFDPFDSGYLFEWDPEFAGWPRYAPDLKDGIAGYTAGGAVYYGGIVGSLIINTCDFIDNKGGAVYCGRGFDNDDKIIFEVNNDYAVNELNKPGQKCTFQGNTDPHQQFELILLGNTLVAIDYNGPSFDKGMGGAIYIDRYCSVDISNANFGGNRAKVDGGAIKSLSSVNITDCAFAGNIAEGSVYDSFTGYGGAIDVYNNGALMNIQMNNCSFVGNESIWGGALSSEVFEANLINCYFINNKAEIGGALDLGMGAVTIDNCNLRGNRATAGNGGAISCRSTEADIENCEFVKNSASGSFASGGAIDFDGAAYPDNVHLIKNCLFAGNSASFEGGAIASVLGAQPNILNSTFSNNKADKFGGSIFAGWGWNDKERTVIVDCILAGSNNFAIYEEIFGGNALAHHCLFYNNPDGHYYDSDMGPVFDVNDIPDGYSNLNGDPLFVTGSFGNYYLSQIAAGQDANSPAVDNGSALASVLGLDTKTTRNDTEGDINDTGQVDRGYHYVKEGDVPRYLLTTSVVGGQGTISPGGTYYAGTVVDINAQPQAGWVIKSWTGTEDDSEVALTSMVVMNSDREVTVEFKQPRTLLVAVGGGDGWYSNVADAMSDANDGDIIIVYPGLYHGPEIQFYKSVEVRSLYPDDPNCVENTILDFEVDGHTRSIIFFPRGTNSGAVLNGFTLRNSTWFGNTLLVNSDNPGEDGASGSGANGAGIWIGPEAGPIIKNCIIRDNAVLGGFGGNGADADENHNAGRGGWSGWARGGGIYCSVRSYPKFINCQVLNNQAVGGIGGQGGNYAEPGGWANYGGNYSRADWFVWDPRDTSELWVSGDLYVRWTEIDNERLNELESKPGDTRISYWTDDYWISWAGYFGDYRWYSGYGGGVFINEGSNVTFENCVISGNLAQGGLSGLGGDAPTAGPMRPMPYPRQYELPAFGGGVYIAADSNVIFRNCEISNNTASDPLYDHQAFADSGGNGGQVTDGYEAGNTYSLDPYLGHGGGICAENSAQVTFVDCNISGNAASVGGGLFEAKANLTASNCEFLSNSALQGGGMFGQNGPLSLTRCSFANNLVLDDPCDPEVFGQGGGLHFWSVQADIFDSIFTGNVAESAAGGAYFGGQGSSRMHNCLITENTAGKMGGGVAATTFAQLKLSNCSIVDNDATGGAFGDGFGGGVYASHESYVDIIDSILWGNYAFTEGRQIAIGTLDYPAAVKVTYSDVQGGEAGVYDPTDALVWDIGDTEPNYPSNIISDPLFIGDYFLSYIGAGQLINSPCVNAGSASVDAPDIDLADYTTRTDGVLDTGIVDMGYHHVGQSYEPGSQFTLIVQINGPGTYTVSPPNIGPYTGGTIVTITVYPEPGYRVSQWIGTNNDASGSNTNTVTMTSDKNVTITLGVPQFLTVPGDYTTIQAAIEAARTGDTISVASGVYHGRELNINKEITITSTNPDDPCVVAATIIDSSGYANRAIQFGSNARENTILSGFTIIGGSYFVIASPDADGSGQNGPDGGSIAGGAVLCYVGSSPTIKNCVIRDTNITAGNAGNASAAGNGLPGGRGGWGGWARGGGVYVAPLSSPTFINCTVTNCTVTGGNAGNGGNSAGTPGVDYLDAGIGGLWSNDFTNPWWEMVSSNGDQYIGDYRFYSGYGAGAFCEQYSSPTFIACNITNNTALGGLSGIGGDRPWARPDPVTAFRIPSYGGGVYCAENSNVTFIDCNITGNIAPKPDATFHLDPYLGHGGGIAFEDTASVKLQNCNISDNISAVGGGIYWSGGEPEVIDCNIRDNVAYVGGGIFVTESAGYIQNCNIYSNFAGILPNDVDIIIGQGGGVFFSATDTDIFDSYLSDNAADASGGAIYTYGPDTEGTDIWNCLFVNNQAGRDGGAMSITWGSKTIVSLCTVYSNEATGDFGITGSTGYGGGLYCSYGATAKVIDSIFLNDAAVFGPEIAVATGFQLDPMCGTVNVSYSDIEGGEPNVYVGNTCTLNWGPGNLNTNPLFTAPGALDFYLQQIDSGQKKNSPCLNAGSDLSVNLGLLVRYTTSTLGRPDLGKVDMGYHYPRWPCRMTDLSGDNFVNFDDFAFLAQSWLNGGCSDLNGWCDNRDFSFNGVVGLTDVLIMSDCWLEEMPDDIKAPKPNPMTWEIPPRRASLTSVEMEATLASDSSGAVQYYFYETTGAGHDSGWQNDPCYIDVGLDPADPEADQFCYEVRARDRFNNITGPSELICVTNLADGNAPEPPPTMLKTDANNVSREDIFTSAQFQWDPLGFNFDWWHKIIVDVSGVTDDGGGPVEIRFICSNNVFSSLNKVPEPIYIGDTGNLGSEAQGWRLTFNGNLIIYDVLVEPAGATGRTLNWRACAYDEAMNEACSLRHTIGPYSP